MSGATAAVADFVPFLGWHVVDWGGGGDLGRQVVDRGSGGELGLQVLDGAASSAVGAAASSCRQKRSC